MFRTEITGCKSTALWPVSSATTLRHRSRMAPSMSVDCQGDYSEAREFYETEWRQCFSCKYDAKNPCALRWQGARATHTQHHIVIETNKKTSSLSCTRRVDSLSHIFSYILWLRHLKQSTIFFVSGPSYSTCWWCLFGSLLAKLAALLGASTVSDFSRVCYSPFVHAMVMR